MWQSQRCPDSRVPIIRMVISQVLPLSPCKVPYPPSHLPPKPLQYKKTGPTPCPSRTLPCPSLQAGGVQRACLPQAGGLPPLTGVWGCPPDSPKTPLGRAGGTDHADAAHAHRPSPRQSLRAAAGSVSDLQPEVLQWPDGQSSSGRQPRIWKEPPKKHFLQTIKQSRLARSLAVGQKGGPHQPQGEMRAMTSSADL